MYSVFLLMQEEMPGLDYLLENNEIVRKMFGSEKEWYWFYNKYARGKDLVWGKAIVSGATATMRGPFGSLFAVVKVFAEWRSWRGRLRSGSRGILLVLDGLLNLWLHGIRTKGSGMWRISSMNTTIRWRNETLLVFCVHIEESAMSKKLILWRCRFLGSANTR